MMLKVQICVTSFLLGTFDQILANFSAVLSDCETGYISCFEPYFGQPTTDALPRPGEPFTTRIMMHLVDQLATKGAGYHIYTDRFYTSPTLAVQLLEAGMYTTGTVQKNRKGLPEDLKRLRLKNHETKVYRHSSKMLMALGWHDKRTVLMLSTWHRCEEYFTSNKRRAAGRS